MERLAFLDRKDELGRIAACFRRRAPSLVVLYGRRRCGKSRLLQEALTKVPAAYYLADEREVPLQRRAMAKEIARVVEGFDRVEYPGWDALLERFRRDAPRGCVLAIDELPYLVARSPELPSLLQKHVDSSKRPVHLALCGSSQRMMLGLALDANAPLYGRTDELLRIGPLGVEEVANAFDLHDGERCLRVYALFGGVPRYWELARRHRDPFSAMRADVLDPLGVLHREPEHLLADDLRDQAQAASVLSLVGQGCHRSSEIAGRLGVPATSLSRPIARLVELGFLSRDVPFGTSARDSKKSLYRVADPFLRFWYRFVQPNLSRLEVGEIASVVRAVKRDLDHHVGAIWEQLVRERASRLTVERKRFTQGSRWWGTGIDGKPLELDVVATAVDDPDAVLVGEAKLRCRDEARVLADLKRRAALCPALSGKRVTPVLFIAVGTAGPSVLTAQEVLGLPNATRSRTTRHDR